MRGQSQCNFDSGLCNYAQNPSRELQWERGTSVASGESGSRVPLRDATSGIGDFMFVNSSTEVGWIAIDYEWYKGNLFCFNINSLHFMLSRQY